MRYEVTGDDGARVRVDAFDWMMAMVHAIDLLDLEVSGWVCETRADGSTLVVDPMSGRSWTVCELGAGSAVPGSDLLAGRTISPRAAAADDPAADRPTPPRPAAGAPPATVPPSTSVAPPATVAPSASAPTPAVPPRGAEPSARSAVHPVPPPTLPPMSGLRPAGPPRGHSADLPPRRPAADRPRRRAATSFPTGQLVVGPTASVGATGAPPPNLAERLFDRTMDLTAAASADEACRVALDLVLELVACEAGSVLRGGLNDDHLRFAAVAGPAASQLLGQQIPFGHGIVGTSFDLGIAIEVADVSDDPRHAAQIDQQTGFRTRAVLCVPVQGADQYHGAIQILNPIGGRFSPWHREVVEQVASSLATALDGVAR